MPPISGLARPTEPGEPFDLTEPRLSEVEGFLKKARAGSAPGPNGVSYKVYKKCGRLRKFMWCLIKVVWRQGVIPSSCCKADGGYISKEENFTSLDQFRPISLLNVEGKIMFGILGKEDFFLCGRAWFG